MTLIARVLPVRASGALIGAALVLAACASTGPSSPGAPAKGPAAPAAPPVVTMAPIANPTEERRERPGREPVDRENAPGRPEAKPETAKPPAPKAAPPPAPAAKTGPDPQRAARLRAQGLTRLNGGQVDRAVALLQEAAQLDPGNALIRKDLERALRISRLVHGGK